MKPINELVKEFFNPKIEICNSVHGKYVIKLSANNHQHFHEKKDARDFIKNYTKEI